MVLPFRSLDIILSEDEGQNNIVAQCRLPFSFNILSKLQKRRRLDQDDGDPPAPEPRVVRRRTGEASTLAERIPLGDDLFHDPPPAIGDQSTLQGVQSLQNGSSSSLLFVQPLQSPRDAGPSSVPPNSIESPNQAVPTLGTDGKRPPTLTEVNPDAGSTTGGARIWLKGMGFPALPLFAKFGAAIVPTVGPCF